MKKRITAGITLNPTEGLAKALAKAKPKDNTPILDQRTSLMATAARIMATRPENEQAAIALDAFRRMASWEGIPIASSPEAPAMALLGSMMASGSSSGRRKLANLASLTEHQANATVNRCVTASEKAAQESIADGGDADEARNAASVAFVGQMPPLTTRTNVLAYLGCVSVAMAFRFIDGRTASAMTYLAQTALSALAGEKGKGK